MHLGSTQFSFRLFRLHTCPLTHTRLFSSAGTGRHNRREGSGGWGKQATEREGLGEGGLTNESCQVTFTDVEAR